MNEEEDDEEDEDQDGYMEAEVGRCRLIPG
jgi:hypothetical protein